MFYFSQQFCCQLILVNINCSLAWTKINKCQFEDIKFQCLCIQAHWTHKEKTVQMDLIRFLSTKRKETHMSNVQGYMTTT